MYNFCSRDEKKLLSLTAGLKNNWTLACCVASSSQYDNPVRPQATNATAPFSRYLGDSRSRASKESKRIQ